MSYLTPRSAAPVPPDVVLVLAGVAGLTVVPEDLAQLAVALADQLGSMEVLDLVDLDDFNPIVEFDPRWHGGLLELSLTAAGEQVKAREVSSVDLVEATLRRIDETEPVVHAYATVMAASARADAARLDGELADGH
jgi:hypothetical protein